MTAAGVAGADGYRVTACNTCGAPVVWATSPATRRSAPIDAEPTTDGNVEVYRHGGNVLFRVVTDTPLMPVPLRTSHFATCPDADTWRKRDHG